MELIPIERPPAGRRDLSVRAGHQCPRRADRELPGSLQRCLEPIDPAPRSGARARQGSRAGAAPAPAPAPVDERTPAESTHTTCIPWASASARSQPSASNAAAQAFAARDRKSTRLNSSHGYISYAVFCLKKKKKHESILR